MPSSLARKPDRVIPPPPPPFPREREGGVGVIMKIWKNRNSFSFSFSGERGEGREVRCFFIKSFFSFFALSLLKGGGEKGKIQ